MATALKTPPAGMTGAVRSLQWAIQDLNGSVEHLGQSNDHLRHAQNIMAWTTAIFGALLLSGLVWIANDIFHLKDQMTDTDQRFDGLEAHMTALGTRLDDLNLTIEQVGAELLAGRGSGVTSAATGPEVSVLSTPTGSANLEAAAGVPAETAVLDAAAQPQQASPAPQAPVATAASAAVAPAPAAPAAVAVIAPSPPAPREELTPEELAQQSPVVAATTPAPTPAAEPAAAASTVVAAAPVAEAPATAAPAPAVAAPAPAPAGDLSDDQLLSYNDDQLDPADELLLLDENGNPQ